MLTTTLRLLAAVLATVTAVAPVTTSAQEYPNKVIRIVNPFSTGGPTDPPVRWLAEKLSEHFGQPVIVDFRGGAAGNIGADYVAKSPGDGYTLLFITSSFILSAVTSAKLPFDPVRDFAPVSPVSSGPTLLVVNAKLGVRSVQELIALARKSPGKITFASSGRGGPLHLYGELLKTLTHVDMLHVPYKGAGPGVADLLGGHIDCMFVGLPAVLPHMKSGKVVALAVSSLKRAQALPDLPTLHESGATGFDGSSRYGVLAPASTSRDIVNKLNASLIKVLHTPETRQKFTDFGLEPDTSTPAEFAAYIREQIAKWNKVARAAGVEPE